MAFHFGHNLELLFDSWQITTPAGEHFGLHCVPINMYSLITQWGENLEYIFCQLLQGHVQASLATVTFFSVVQTCDTLTTRVRMVAIATY